MIATRIVPSIVVLLAPALAALALAATPAEQRSDSSAAPPSASVPGLASGDAIRLASWREKDMSGDYPIDESGVAVLPILGAKRLTGIPPAQLKEQLRAEYDQHLRNSDLQITVLRRVRVLGAVNAPGVYHVDPTMTIADVVALAGGATTEGVMKKAQIVRNGETAMQDLGAETLLAEQLQSGDQIFVPERPWVVRYSSGLAQALIGAFGFILGVR
jgi:polysaccharide export outer membrane protein